MLINNEKQITKPETGPELILNWEGSQYNGSPWTDSSSNGNQGSLRGPGVSYNSSFSPLSIEFTNTSTTPNQGDIIATAWNNGPLGTTPFTIAFWILPTDQTNNQGVAAWGTVANNGFFDISIIPASGVFRAVGTTNFASLGDLPVNYNVWQHVVYTFGSQFVDGYIDGTYLTSGLWNGNISSYTNAFRFASGLRSDITRKFNGRLRSISIWRNKLTTDQVVNEYNSNDFIDLEVIRLDAANYLVTKVTWDNLKLNQPDFTFTAIATKSTSGGGSIRFAGTNADPVLTCASNPISGLVGTRYIGQNFTIMFWLNPDANQNNNATIIAVGWNPAAPLAGWTIRQNGTSNNNYLIKSIKQNGAANSDVPFTLTAGGWQHLAITFNETQGIKVYTNATLVATGTDYNGFKAEYQSYRIGSTTEFGGTTGRWTGNIAYHVAWKKVLTIEEISAIYTSQLNRYTSTPTP